MAFLAPERVTLHRTSLSLNSSLSASRTTMDEVSPAVVDDCQLQTSGWEKSQSISPFPAAEDSSTTQSESDNVLGETLSSAITAATVTLLDKDHVSTPPSVLGQEAIGQEIVDITTLDQPGGEIEGETGIEEDLEHKNKKIKTEESSEELPIVQEVVALDAGSNAVKSQSISVTLEGHDLWQQFYHAGTEMIITKTGRRMFPGIVVSVDGLDPEYKYNISLEVNLADDHRYKFVNSKWVVVGKAESHDEEMLFFNHPESPATGKHWMKNKVSFKKIKLSNNRNNKRGQVVALNSMHKYLPRVIVSKFITKKKSIVVHTHNLEECAFVAVTAYQNDRVTQLKIDYNPFAKAFRESSGEQEMYNGYNQGMMGAWPPLSPLLSPYGPNYSNDCAGTPGLLSPASLQPSPLPQFNTAFGNFESPPYSPSYRQQTHGPGLQQQLFGMTHHQPKPSPLPRFNSVFNNWDIPHDNQSSLSPGLALNHHPQSAFMAPRMDQNASVHATNTLQ